MKTDDDKKTRKVTTKAVAHVDENGTVTISYEEVVEEEVVEEKVKLKIDTDLKKGIVMMVPDEPEDE